MEKTLTEQWKDGELPNGYYWCRILDNEEDAFMQHLIAGHFEYSPSFIKEVLAPVPSYEEFVQQRDFVKDHQKLLIENMNLKLKIERLQEQLEEANMVILSLPAEKISTCMIACEYLDKWGVK